VRADDLIIERGSDRGEPLRTRLKAVIRTVREPPGEP